jgi:hypothetical protein
VTGGHIEIALSEVHTARNAIRDALIALYDAVRSGEAMDPAFRRMIHSELTGASEEAAMLAAVLAAAGREPGR